ncbi:rRNA maturation RNase YbeY [Pseudomonas sp. GX19020]|uniref:rRNA maturation RNase YbeY n=1 Tax=Pseudomonadota TaxID=1224 RepID=UPI0008976EB4|nr:MULTISPECIES: rRNA maturation RNase YbeY [Pseudomonadota]MCL4069309.1 rRNA maturation RNase YbeY [Pseudomonas sp. GX19020]SEB48090.1 probable rRNA maturation factor [Rhodobacter sp. 24-YEA-8]
MEQIVDTVFEDPRWQEFGLEGLAETAAAAVFAQLGLSPTGFLISLLACDDQRIAALNTEFRGKPVPTNVLSWPSEERAAEEAGGIPDLPEPGDAEDPEELGDIAIAYETCMREAAEQEKAPREHVAHLMVHGILHLLGYDHIDDADAAVMENLETRILAGLGIPDPY